MSRAVRSPLFRRQRLVRMPWLTASSPAATAQTVRQLPKEDTGLAHNTARTSGCALICRRT